jgi:hypothetical protein
LRTRIRQCPPATHRQVLRLALPRALALCAGLALSGYAAASENYPGIIETHTGVDCPRPLTRCLICHDTAAGGEETANQPFAVALVESYGLPGGKAGRELAAALDAVPDDVDTDSDGTPDQEELARCGNPSGEELSEGPGYGCNANLAAARSRANTSGSCGAVIGALLTMGLLLRKSFI